MAIYHLSAQIIKRKDGRSAIVAAAYRAGERLVDRESGTVADYRNKGGIVHTEIRTPQNSPEWMQDRETLWNVLEYKNRRVDAQLAREMNIALPRELPFEQQKELLRRFVDDQFVSKGMVADLAIHHDEEQNNPHAHVMLSFYAANENGFKRTRTREWSSKDFLNETREAWSTYANRALEAMGHEERIDHRTLEAQGIDRMPTIHEGPKGRKARDRGYAPSSKVVDMQTYAGRRRQLNYQELDEGRSRAQQNARILQFNERQVTKRIAEAFDAMDSWMRLRFMEATIKRAGGRLRDARRARRSADGSIRFWAKTLKSRQRSAIIERVFGNRPWRVKRQVQLISIAEKKLKQAKRRYAIARQQELTAERDYRRGKLALGRDRKERHERRRRSVARWTGMIDLVAPNDIRLDRMPEGKQDPRWLKIMGWLASTTNKPNAHAPAADGIMERPKAGNPPEIPTLVEAAAVEERESIAPVTVALAAQEALERQRGRIEKMEKLRTKIMQMEHGIARGVVPAEELRSVKDERAAVVDAAGGDNAWAREGELKAAYDGALERLDVSEVQSAEISEEQREALLAAKRRRDVEGQRQDQRHKVQHVHRHKIS